MLKPKRFSNKQTILELKLQNFNKRLQQSSVIKSEFKLKTY